MNEEFLSEVSEPTENNPNSILCSIKKMLNLDGIDDFDVDVIIHINTALFTLTQLGVGPVKGFSITDKSTVWTDFVPDVERIEAIKTYVYLKVKLIFDPPQSGPAIESMNKLINEYEVRINIAAESMAKEATENE